MRFNLDDYETVESRIKRFYELYEDGRIVTEWENNNRFEVEAETKTPKTWVIRASIFLTAGDQANHLPKATGFAFEVDGTGGANNTSALENAETSAIGRALANMNLSGNKRASREEMQKVAKADTDWTSEADKVMNVEQARALYAKAKAAKAPNDVLDRLKEIGQALSSGSKDS
jgi:hypothetical protein